MLLSPLPTSPLTMRPTASLQPVRKLTLRHLLNFGRDAW